MSVSVANMQSMISRMLLFSNSLAENMLFAVNYRSVKLFVWNNPTNMFSRVVIGYADSGYDVVNYLLLFFMCEK